ncbi:hypothetical protein CCACVL1_17746 [Corchorus capsularis]|uniref:Uncharacterized protein n=1 Tax=Corchorus capsularis TaxID=210143 RepID=A0A1R3HQE4_COCAP|nr:hypothetical protein CCACVL1_17746 [Corchorus capsularis]
MAPRMPSTKATGLLMGFANGIQGARHTKTCIKTYRST